MTAITNLKSGRLDKVLKQLGWTQSELARRSNMCLSTVEDIINLAKYPTEEEANTIQIALGEAGEYLDVLELWSATFAPQLEIGGLEHPSEVQLESLWNHPEVMRLPAPEYGDSGLDTVLETTMARLPKRMHEVLKRRFWKGETLQRIGEGMGVTRARAQQMVSNGLRKLKDPTWARQLAAYMPRHLKSSTSIIGPGNGIYFNGSANRCALKGRRNNRDEY